MIYILQDAPDTFLFPVLPQFIQAFTQFLAMPDSLTSDCGLKMDILKVILQELDLIFLEEIPGCIPLL